MATAIENEKNISKLRRQILLMEAQLMILGKRIKRLEQVAFNGVDPSIVLEVAAKEGTAQAEPEASEVGDGTPTPAAEVSSGVVGNGNPFDEIDLDSATVEEMKEYLDSRSISYHHKAGEEKLKEAIKGYLGV